MICNEHFVSVKDTRIDRQKDRQKDRQIGRKIDRQKDRQKDRQIDRINDHFESDKNTEQTVFNSDLTAFFFIFTIYRYITQKKKKYV